MDEIIADHRHAVRSDDFYKPWKGYPLLARAPAEVLKTRKDVCKSLEMANGFNEA